MRTRAEVVVKRIEEAGLYRTTMERAYQGEASPRQAIKAQCLICVGYDRKAIRDCTGFSCPLWMYRPYQNSGGSESGIDAANKSEPNHEREG